MKSLKQLSLLCISFLLILLDTQAQETRWSAMVVGIIGEPVTMFESDAVISPDGTKYIYLGSSDVCFFAIDGEAQGCLAFSSLMIDLSAKRWLRWSPDSRYVVFTENFLSGYNDPDIWVIDSQELSIVNLSYDFVETLDWGDFDWNGNQDISPRWLQNSDIFFLRTNRIDGQFVGEFRTIRVDGLDERRVDFLGQLNLPTFAVTVAPQAPIVAYGAYISNLPEIDKPYAIVTIANLDEKSVSPILVTQNPIFEPDELRLSYTGEYIITVDARADYNVNFEGVDESGIRYLPTDIVSDEPKLIDQRYAFRDVAWSPDSNAIAYVVRYREPFDEEGLYIASEPGEVGQLVLKGRFRVPLDFTDTHFFEWASNGMMLLRNADTNQIVIVKVEKQ